MSLAPGLALMVLLAAGAPLDEARRSFAEGRYADAEQQALQAAGDAPSGDALYLVGLARFRAGKPAAALEALDAAGRTPDAPERAAWSFNRGACLYALGRFEEAERAFAEAGEDAALARVAWVNAGFAAFDAGFPERAAQWADLAAPGASEQEASLVRELRALLPSSSPVNEGDETYRRGLAAFDAGRFEEARTLFLRAAALEPATGRARLMAGASAWRMGAREEAREDVLSSLTLSLNPMDRRTARQYLDRLSFGLRASGPGVWLSLVAGPGFDSNVLQVGVAARDVTGATADNQVRSAFAEAEVVLSTRLRLSDTLFAVVSYDVSQRAYAREEARDYSLQLHRASAAVEWEGTHRLRWGLLAGGDVFFTGLDDFRGLQASVSGGTWLAWDASESMSTRLDLGIAGKNGLGSEFDYLTGTRLDATLSQELQVPFAGMTVWYRYREDRIGTLVQPLTVDTSGVSWAWVIPFAFAGHAVGGSAHWEPRPWLGLGLDAEVEWRRYLEDSTLRVESTTGAVEFLNPRGRRDVRFTLAPTVSARVFDRLRLSARYDLLVNRSNLDRADDYTNGDYEKHVLMLQLDATW